MSAFDQTLTYFDLKWQQSYGECLAAWIVNTAHAETLPSDKASTLRKLACFCTPDVCTLEGKNLIFIDVKPFNAAKHICTAIFKSRGIYSHVRGEKGVQATTTPYTWSEMDTGQRNGFARAIWMDRDTLGGNAAPFPTHIQELLCRLADAPHPNELKKLLDQQQQSG